MTPKLKPLLPLLQSLARVLTLEQGEVLATVLAQSDGHSWPRLRYALLSTVVRDEAQRPLKALLNRWQEMTHPPAPSLLSAALLGASHSFYTQQREQSIELVWTGPEASMSRLRRTQQVLIELIRSAREQVLVVSFAVYRAQSVTEELVRAAQRGVRLQICLEAPEPSDDHITYDTIQALGEAVTQRAQIYIWPRDQRTVDGNGPIGSLHAKCAVADQQMLFLSSANLTEYALNHNMELGVLISGGPLPGEVHDNFGQLIERGVLKDVS